MLDWFSRLRLKSESRLGNSKPLYVGRVLPNYFFRNRQGELVKLSDFGTPLLLIVLPSEPDTGTAHFLRSLQRKFAWVRGKPTRFLVVTRPEYLSTVVALSDHLEIVADESGDAMLELVPDNAPIFYVLGSGYEIIDYQKDDGRNILPRAA